MSFGEASFGGPANFSWTRFSRESVFSGSTFQDSANFDDSKMSAACAFSGTRFLSLVPTFNGASLHDGVDFTGAEISSFSRGEDEAAYRFLKRTMESRRDRKEQARFFACELRARRSRLKLPSVKRFFSASYGLFANYGQSISRPLWAFLAILLVASVVYYSLAVDGRVIAQGDPGKLAQTALEFGIQQYVRPFAIWSSGYASHIDWVEPNLGVLRWLALAQSLLGVGALTLFVLAVRRKFRLE